jgi:guanylate kinase
MIKKKCLVFSGPSGVGKSTLIRFVLQTFEFTGSTISCTTRPRRQGEADGIDYHFLSPDKFDELVKRGEFLEHVECYGYRYGTLKSAVCDILRTKKLCIINLDFHGAYNILQEGLLPEYDCEGVLILPPSIKQLEYRLMKRKTDSTETIKLRLDKSFGVSRIANYRYIIVNDTLSCATTELAKIIRSFST